MRSANIYGVLYRVRVDKAIGEPKFIWSVPPSASSTVMTFGQSYEVYYLKINDVLSLQGCDCFMRDVPACQHQCCLVIIMVFVVSSRFHWSWWVQTGHVARDASVTSSPRRTATMSKPRASRYHILVATLLVTRDPGMRYVLWDQQCRGGTLWRHTVGDQFGDTTLPCWCVSPATSKANPGAQSVCSYKSFQPQDT